MNEGASLGFVNFMSHYIIRPSDDPEGFPFFQPDYAAEINLAENVEALVDNLDLKLTAGQLSESARADIMDVVSTMNINADTAEEDRRKRVQTAVLMVVASGAYAAQN